MINLKAVRLKVDSPGRRLYDPAAMRELLEVTEALAAALLDAHAELLEIASYSGAGGNWPLQDAVTKADAALTLAGFPDQASRDAERARRAGR